MIQLSYSSLNILHTCPHNWLNKQMGIPQPEKPEWAQGKKVHQIIQAHVSGKKQHKDLKHIKFRFPVVEEKDFDDRCRFEFDFGKGFVIGFMDGIDEKSKRFLEIKSADPQWSLGKFQKSMQRKLYAHARPEFTEAILITCSKNIDSWMRNPPKVYKVPLTEQDRKDAFEWILAGFEILESGNFTTDLVDGKCLDPRCWWGASCQFK